MTLEMNIIFKVRFKNIVKEFYKFTKYLLKLNLNLMNKKIQKNLKIAA